MTIFPITAQPHCSVLSSVCRCCVSYLKITDFHTRCRIHRKHQELSHFLTSSLFKCRPVSENMQSVAEIYPRYCLDSIAARTVCSCFKSHHAPSVRCVVSAEPIFPVLTPRNNKLFPFSGKSGQPPNFHGGCVSVGSALQSCPQAILKLQ